MKGPENADQAQLEMLRKIERRSKANKNNLSEENLSRNQGEVSWEEVEVLFSDQAIQEFSQGKTKPERKEEIPVLRALDQIYDSLKTTSSGNSKLKGIQSINNKIRILR